MWKYTTKKIYLNVCSSFEYFFNLRSKSKEIERFKKKRLMFEQKEIIWDYFLEKRLSNLKIIKGLVILQKRILFFLHNFKGIIIIFIMNG